MFDQRISKGGGLFHDNIRAYVLARRDTGENRESIIFGRRKRRATKTGTGSFANARSQTRQRRRKGYI